MTTGGAQKGNAAVAFLRFLIIAGFLGAAAVGGIWWELDRRFAEEGPLREAQILWVERGNTVKAVGEKLEDMDAVDDSRVFRLAARLERLSADLKAGEYEIPAAASVDDIVSLLADGKPMLRFVTVPEGRTSRQVVAIVNEAAMLTGTIDTVPAEGALLPETYSYQRGDTRQSVIDRMAAAHDEVLTALWVERDADLPLETAEEAVILASIVEKETGLAEERPLVASVFVNRLRKGMRLQSDPTIIYGLTGGEPLGRGIRRSELDRETPYNTYIIRGLPPTPIANPGQSALAAVLNPPQTDYLYFVADGTGGHVFASTLEEHNRNVAAWRRIERERAAAAAAND